MDPYWFDGPQRPMDRFHRKIHGFRSMFPEANPLNSDISPRMLNPSLIQMTWDFWIYMFKTYNMIDIMSWIYGIKMILKYLQTPIHPP